MIRICSIHQPNFFPWLGYFDKIARSNQFVILDDVQFQKRSAGTWTNRVKLYIANEARWVTAGIDRNYLGTRKINEMRFTSSEDWRGNMIKTIELNYKRHSHYDEVNQLLYDLIRNPENNIATYNTEAIIKICKAINLDISKIQISSQLPHEGASNELLCSLSKAVKCETYMCGGGADDYQDQNVFDKYNVKLIRQNFEHPVYPQKHKGEFVAGLSIIDALMNLGFKGVAQLLDKGTHG